MVGLGTLSVISNAKTVQFNDKSFPIKRNTDHVYLLPYGAAHIENRRFTSSHRAASAMPCELVAREKRVRP